MFKWKTGNRYLPSYQGNNLLSIKTELNKYIIKYIFTKIYIYIYIKNNKTFIS